MKAYTDLEQSKKLSKILPIENADMHYNNVSIKGINYVDEYRAELIDYNTAQKVLSKYLVNPMFRIIPCWSLAALLEEIPDTIINMVGEDLKLHIDKDGFQYSLFYENEYTGNMFEIETELYDDMIDACYEMIIKLNEQKLL